jgi:hypothetical protein
VIVLMYVHMYVITLLAVGLASLQVSVSWAVQQGPATFLPSMITIYPYSAAAGASWANFSETAPAGNYTLRMTASDGSLARNEDVIVQVLRWPAALGLATSATLNASSSVQSGEDNVATP